MTDYEDTYDSEGRWIARIYADDPTHPESWRDEYDSEGRWVARTYANDPAHPESWRREFDSKGREVALVYANDPAHPEEARRSETEDTQTAKRANPKDQTRNLNPTPEAQIAMIIWGKEYAETGLGSMDFWDRLSPDRQRRCHIVYDTVSKIVTETTNEKR